MLKARTRIFYGIGGGVYSVKEAAYAIFILLFYTQVLGLSGTVTGVILALSLLWDAISDPLIGSWSDRLCSRYGRRHPFMVYSTIPLAIGFIGLFAPPGAVVASSTLLAIWLLFWSLWVRTFTTTFSIPHLALCAELSSDYDERSQLMGMRVGISFLVTVSLPAAAFIFVFNTQQGVDGRFIAENYLWYGILSAGVVMALGAITVMGTRLHTSRPDTRGEKYSLPGFRHYIDDILETFRNKGFRTILSYEIASAISWGGISAMNILVATYVFEFNTQQMAIILAMPGIVAVVLVWALLKPLGRRWQKPQLLRFALWGLLLNSLWLLPLKLANMLPENDSPLILALNLLNNTLFMFFFFLRITNSMSIVADITDQHELEQGERKEGGFFSVMTFAIKMSTLIGPLYGGIVLDVIGLSQHDLPGEVAESVLAGLMLAVLLIAVPALLVALWYAYKIDCSKEHMQQVQGSLRERSTSA